MKNRMKNMRKKTGVIKAFSPGLYPCLSKQGYNFYCKPADIFIELKKSLFINKHIFFESPFPLLLQPITIRPFFDSN